MEFLFLIITLTLTFGLYKLIEFIEYKVFKREKPENSNISVSDLMNNILKSKSKSKSKSPKFGQRNYNEKNYGTTREDLINNIKNIQAIYRAGDDVYDFVSNNYKNDGNWGLINHKLSVKYPKAFK